MIHPGELAHGGRVFYADETGQHGMVVALEYVEIQWGCYGTSISGADGQAIGTGYQNTLDIVAGCSDPNTAAFMALNSTDEGYTDWYLPSFDELMEIYNTIGGGGPEGNIGGFSSGIYLSSTEYDDFRVKCVGITNGLIYFGITKNSSRRAYFIRSF